MINPCEHYQSASAPMKRPGARRSLLIPGAACMSVACPTLGRRLRTSTLGSSDRFSRSSVEAAGREACTSLLPHWLPGRARMGVARARRERERELAYFLTRTAAI